MNRIVAALLPVLLISACNLPEPKRPPLHATTVYIVNDILGSAGLPAYLQATLPAVKQTGFDLVYLPAVWRDFDPTPLTGPYNNTAFADARAALSVLRNAGMRALVGLNYVGVGYAPDFGGVLPPDQACNWAITPQVYVAFERYAQQVMKEYAAFSDMLQLMVFTEGAEGCGLATPQAAPAVAQQLQTTLGSLPTRLPAMLRAQWRLGYHDYSIVNLGWGNGIGRLLHPIPSILSVCLPITWTARRARHQGLSIQSLVALPLIVGEAGAHGCPGATPPQAAVDSLIVSWAVSRRYGFNIWGWPNAGAAECTNPV